jgi:hypothetical protein
LMLVPTALVLWWVPKCLSAVVLSAEGIALERLGWVAWRLPWSQYAGWGWLRKKDGPRPIALRLVRDSGQDLALTMSEAGYRTLVAALQQWAPDKPELPGTETKGRPRWLKRLCVSFGIAFLLSVFLQPIAGDFWVFLQRWALVIALVTFVCFIVSGIAWALSG